MGGAVFLSRILGLVREQVFAYFFGAGMATDAFLVAFRIPNLLRDLFAEGALSSAFVTVFSRESNKERSQEMARHVLLAQSLVVLLCCILIFIFSEQIVHWIAPEFARIDGKLELTTQLTRYLSPFLLFVASAALSMGILNSIGYFFVPALGSAAFNLGSILVGGIGAWFMKEQGVVAMISAFTVGSLSGGILQWVVQWPLLIKEGYSPVKNFSQIFTGHGISKAFADPALRKIVWLMAPSVLAVAAVQINVFINTVIASELAQGSVTWLNYSFRLLHFPLGVFGVALSVAALPSFSRLWAEGNHQRFHQTLRQSLRLTWILAFGSAAGLIAFREPLVAMIFEHGRFSRTDTLETAAALAAYALALPALNSTKIFVQVFYALDKVWIPSLISIILVFSHYFLATYFGGLWGHTGLALAIAATSFLNALLLAIVLSVKGFKLLDLESIKVLVGSIAGALIILLVDISGLSSFLLVLKKDSFVFFFILTVFLIVTLGAVHLMCASLPSQELRQVMHRLVTKIKSKLP